MKKAIFFLFALLPFLGVAQTPQTPLTSWNQKGRPLYASATPELLRLDSLYKSYGAYPVVNMNSSSAPTPTIAAGTPLTNWNQKGRSQYTYATPELLRLDSNYVAFGAYPVWVVNPDTVNVTGFVPYTGADSAVRLNAQSITDIDTAQGNTAVFDTIYGVWINATGGSFVPYSGATGDVNLGTHKLRGDSLISTHGARVDSLNIGRGNNAGINNTIIGGLNTGKAITTGLGLTCIGYQAFATATTGSSITAIGANAMANATNSTSTSVAVGNNAFQYGKGSGVVAVGNSALSGASYNAANGFSVAIGTNAGAAITTGNKVNYIGYNAMSVATTGSSNTALGAFTGFGGGYDFRTVSNYVILSDGDGNMRMYFNGANANIPGNISLLTAGNKISIATGTNASTGTATLAAGTVTVSTTAVTASSLIYFSYQNCSNCGTLFKGTVTAGTSFVINSNNLSDASNVAWWIIN